MNRKGVYRWKRLVPKIHKKKKQYRRYRLCNDEEQRLYLAHRLVLMAFVGPCPKGKEGCHDDNNPANNWLWNLRWDTQSGNQKDRLKHGTDLRGTKCPHAVLTEEKVRSIRLEWKNNHQKWKSKRQLAVFFSKRINVSFHTIHAVLCNKTTWPHVVV